MHLIYVLASRIGMVVVIPLGYFKMETLMNKDIERNLGEQPIAGIMKELDLKPHDLVSASTEQITHKMVSRACKGRKLTLNTQTKVLNALNTATNQHYSLKNLFTY